MHPQPYPPSRPYGLDASNHHPHDLGLFANDDDELSYCYVNTIDGVIHANQHSFDRYAHYHCDESEKINQIFTAGISIVIQPPTSKTTTATFLPPPYSFDASTHSSDASWTDSITIIHDEMTTCATQPPGSPPDWSESPPQSSKSSSLHSSSLFGADAIQSDVTNFEDIGLDEDDSPRNRDSCREEKAGRPVPLTTSVMSGNMENSRGIGHMRELTNGVRRPSYPFVQGSVRGATRHGPKHSLGLPQGGNLKRGFTSPSTPSLAMTAMSNLSRSRSPSPSHLVQSPRPQLQAPSPRILRASSEVKSPIPRRESWQRSRKSVKELEDEYDDLDEDLPEDASLWNVPLSPRPPPERTSTSATNSANVSPGTSPERRSPMRSPLGPVGTKSVGSPPLFPDEHANQAVSSSPRSTSSPLKPRYPRGSSTGTLPDHFCFPKDRAKTWNVALSELSDEAKHLTQALENHAGILELKQEAAVQNGAAPLRPSMERLSRAKTSSVELPPLRISNVMIDPLPASKEKEKVLSRTRPSWLPPKNPQEEKRHLKEYQRMMEMSREAERRKAAKAADVQCAQDDTKSALLRIWEEHVLPNWDRVVREPRTRELWWRGVSPRSRGRVWERAIGNDLALTEATYTKALQRAKDMEARIANTWSDERSKEKAWFDAIRRDIKTVFPHLKIFQLGSPLHDSLLDVLMAYSMYRSDVGYSHGTHLITALLLLTLPTPATTFIALANLLNRPLPLAFLTGDPTSTEKAYRLTCSLLARKLPRLHAHLFSPAPDGLGLSAAEVLEPMIRTLFLAPGEGVGIEAAVRVWDVMVFEGDGLVIRAVVGVLEGLEGSLYGGKDEVLGVLGWGGRRQAGPGKEGAGVESLMTRIRAAGKEGGGGDEGSRKKG
ncbi:hypothetical protein MMC07_002699 [Pseudocyphellaria aurata]|nr:hypothetical protein [Pseudocyphellaria aurata]